MVIEIDEKCLELINEEKYCNFFNSLAYYINNGRNYIYLNKRMLEFLYNSKKIDKRGRIFYKQAFDNSAEDLAIRNSVNRKILVKREKNDNIEIKNGEIIISIDKLIDNNLLENKANLICENLIDCRFFINLTKIYALKNSINSFNIALQSNNGGGSTILDVYKEKEQIGEISLIIVDSDQKFQDSPIGETLRKLLREKQDNSLIEIYPLYVHEIENLIPIKLIENYYKTTRTEERRREVIKFLKTFEAKKLEESPIAYFDMKDRNNNKKVE